MIQSSNNLVRQKASKKSQHNYTINDKQKNTLIVGLNSEAIDLYERICRYPALGFKICGFISVGKISSKSKYQQLPFIGEFDKFAIYIQRLEIDMVLIAIDPSKHFMLDEIIQECLKTNTNYKIVSDVYDTVYGNVIKDVYQDLFQYREFGLRRVIDFIGSIIGFALFMPLFFMIALAIKIESSGSIFYSQQRTGKNGRPFRIYKFRSMIQDAEKQSGPVWAQKKDPRITRMGNFMRITRIDEVPQLINIFKGDMSFVGPRPERPFFVDSFKQQIPFYINRLKIKPGVTGWAQVKWGYDETIEDVKEKLNYDLYYVDNYSLWFDIKILILTIKTVILGKGQ